MNAGWHEAWAAALDELELSLDQAERLLEAHDPVPPPVWQPPALVGPVPDQHVERARRLLDRHLRVTREIATSLAATRQQLQLTQRLADDRPHGGPIYVDVTA